MKKLKFWSLSILTVMLSALAFSGCDVDKFVDELGCNHDYGANATKVITQATCVTEGEELWMCRYCGKEKTEKTAKLDYHALDNGVVMNSPTCTDIGSIQYTCQVEGCVFVKIEDVPSLGHTVVNEDVAPTCTIDGYTGYSYCSVCETVIMEKTVIPALGHNVVQDVGWPATCTNNGLTDGEHCDMCGEVLIAQEEIIVGTGSHVIVDMPTVGATCTQVGSTGGSMCSVCGEVFEESETISPLGHSYSTTDGNCIRCGEHSHSFVESENGTICEYCGVLQEVENSFEMLSGALLNTSNVMNPELKFVVRYDGKYSDYYKDIRFLIAPLETFKQASSADNVDWISLFDEKGLSYELRSNNSIENSLDIYNMSVVYMGSRMELEDHNTYEGMCYSICTLTREDYGDLNTRMVVMGVYRGTYIPFSDNRPYYLNARSCAYVASNGINEIAIDSSYNVNGIKTRLLNVIDYAVDEANGVEKALDGSTPEFVFGEQSLLIWAGQSKTGLEIQYSFNPTGADIALFFENVNETSKILVEYDTGYCWLTGYNDNHLDQATIYVTCMGERYMIAGITLTYRTGTIVEEEIEDYIPYYYKN